MQNWIPNLTWGQYEQTESGNVTSIGLQNNAYYTDSEPSCSFGFNFSYSLGQSFLGYRSAQPSSQVFGNKPQNDYQNPKNILNFPLETRKTLEEKPQFIVQPKDPFSSRNDVRQATPFMSKPLEYPVEQRRKTAQLLLSRCSQEFCQEEVIRQYFETIVPGKVLQVQVKPERGSAIVSFSTEDDAESALLAGTPQGEYKLRMRYFIPRDYRRRHSSSNRDPYFSAETSGNEEEVDESSKMDTEDLPAFESAVPFLSGSLEQSRDWNPFGYSKESLTETRIATDDEFVLKMKRESRFTQNTVSDDEGEVEHIVDTGWRTAGEKQQLSAAQNLSGTCLEMCPSEERSRRELQRDLSIFEIDYTIPTVEGEPPKVDHSKAVKKYVRSAACQEAPKPSEIRPPHILEKTMEYLIENIVDRTDCSFAEVHNFVRDRTRSIRQDFTFQGVRNEMTIDIIEKTVRFHILSEQRLCEEDPSVYSSRQNMEQLDKCLISLREMYRERRTKGLSTSPNEGEFQAYYILSHFDPHSVWAVCRELDVHVLKSRQVAFALRIYQALRSTNYVGFFRLLQRAPYLVACMMQQHFSFIRKSALLIMQRCYSRFPVMPLTKLEELLAFEDIEDLLSFCESLGFVSDYLEDGTRVLRLDNRVVGDELTKYRSRRSLKCIEPKSKDFSVKDIMMGKTEIVENWIPSAKNQRNLFHVGESVGKESLPHKRREGLCLEDSEKKRTTKLSANAPEFIPFSQQQIEQTNSVPLQMNSPLRSVKEDFDGNKNSKWNYETLVKRVDTMSSVQQGMEETIPSASLLLTQFSTEGDDNSPPTVSQNRADRKRMSATPASKFDRISENIPKLDHFNLRPSNPGMPTGCLKRKNLFWSDEGVRRENSSFVEGKKSRIVEEQSEENADSMEVLVQKPKNIEHAVKREGEKVRYGNELWIVSQISQGSTLLKFLPQIRELHWKYKALASKSTVETERNKELSTMIDKTREIRQQLLQFLEGVNAKYVNSKEKKLGNMVRSIRELFEDLEVLTSDMISTQDQWQHEQERVNDAVSSFIRAPAEAVRNYSRNRDRAGLIHTPRGQDKAYSFTRVSQETHSVGDTEVRHKICLMTVKRLGSQKEQKVILQGLKMLSFGVISEKQNSSHFIVPLMDGCCEVWFMGSDTAFEQGFSMMAKPKVLTTVVYDALRINWNLWKKKLKSFISKNFSVAVTMLVFVHNEQYCRESSDLDNLVGDELSQLQKDGFVTSITILLTDRKHLHEYSYKLADIWEKIVNDAERVFQGTKYLWIGPSISTGYYTTLELAMSCVRLAFDELFLCNHSLETLCEEIFGWIANKLLTISSLCLPDSKYRENFDIASKAFQKLCWNANYIFKTLLEVELSKEELVLFITDHSNNWWQNVEDLVESSLGSASTISLPILLDSLLEDKERPGNVRLSKSRTTETRRRNRRADISQLNSSSSHTSCAEAIEEIPEWLQLERQHLAELEDRMRVSTIQDSAILTALIDTKRVLP
ncbi:hypothetical protein GpartN1_g1799.t1 [Galdieria partita]|uniref:RRM domain-containing protein n=1 Tax=Galdieria partita TaxID=83374 RepID=A0A9C7PSN3_9RHOD|nr:hypothetical protein GpartN1_g1799.t1 [Galdieria partita]